MANRTKYLIGGGILFIALLSLIVATTGSTGNYYISIAELREMGSKAYGQRITVSGLVVGESIEYDTSDARTEFTLLHITSDDGEISSHEQGLDGLIADAWEDQQGYLSVVYENVKPDLLKPGAQAVVRGVLQGNGTFLADEVILKCPSKYAAMPEQVIEEEAD